MKAEQNAMRRWTLTTASKFLAPAAVALLIGCQGSSPNDSAKSGSATGSAGASGSSAPSGASAGVATGSGSSSGSESGASGTQTSGGTDAGSDASAGGATTDVGTTTTPGDEDASTFIADDAMPATGEPGVEAGSTSSADVAADLALLKKVALYQVAAGPGTADWVNKWTESVFYIGVMAAYDVTKDASILAAATSWATKNQWTLLDGTTNPPTRSADNQSAGQVYTELYMLQPVSANANEIKNSQASIDAMIAKPSPGHVDWWWCDSLFMAPPLVSRLGAITGAAKYDSFLDTMWSDAANALYDPAEKLFWRDSTFLHTTTYWSRGNGWVMGGIVRVLEDLPATDPQYSTYVNLLKTLAASVAPLQGSDGLWRSDLLHPTTYPNPETSGTALFTYAMAWGIHHSILDRATYLPVVQKAWAGLVANVSSAGKLGYVQGTGSAPAAASASDSYDYGVGAFLLAGSEVQAL